MPGLNEDLYALAQETPATYSKQELREFGKRAAREFVDSATPLNDSVVRFAKEAQLNQDQVQRVVEAANTETFLALHSKTAEGNVEYPLADPEAVHKLVFGEGATPPKFAKTASAKHALSMFEKKAEPENIWEGLFSEGVSPKKEEGRTPSQEKIAQLVDLHAEAVSRKNFLKTEVEVALAEFEKVAEAGISGGAAAKEVSSWIAGLPVARPVRTALNDTLVKVARRKKLPPGEMPPEQLPPEQGGPDPAMPLGQAAPPAPMGPGMVPGGGLPPLPMGAMGGPGPVPPGMAGPPMGPPGMGPQMGMMPPPMGMPGAPGLVGTLNTAVMQLVDVQALINRALMGNSDLLGFLNGGGDVDGAAAMFQAPPPGLASPAPMPGMGGPPGMPPQGMGPEQAQPGAAPQPGPGAQQSGQGPTPTPASQTPTNPSSMG